MVTYLRTNYRITGQTVDDTAIALTGVIVQGSYTDSATDSGYISVSNLLDAAPRTAEAMLVVAAAVKRTVHVKGIDADYVTFVVRCGTGTALSTGSDVSLVWAAHL